MIIKGSYENHTSELKAFPTGKQYDHLTMAKRECISYLEGSILWPILNSQFLGIYERDHQKVH